MSSVSIRAISAGRGRKEIPLEWAVVRPINESDSRLWRMHRSAIGMTALGIQQGLEVAVVQVGVDE